MASEDHKEVVEKTEEADPWATAEKPANLAEDKKDGEEGEAWGNFDASKIPDDVNEEELAAMLKKSRKARATGPDLPRTVVEPEGEPMQGQVIEWKGKYGWILPLKQLTHSKAKKHGGRIYISEVDKQESDKLMPGGWVEFILYEDEDGLGAQECKMIEQPEGAKGFFGGFGKGKFKGKWDWMGFGKGKGFFGKDGKGKGGGKDSGKSGEGKANKKKGEGKGKQNDGQKGGGAGAGAAVANGTPSQSPSQGPKPSPMQGGAGGAPKGDRPAKGGGKGKDGDRKGGKGKGGKDGGKDRDGRNHKGGFGDRDNKGKGGGFGGDRGGKGKKGGGDRGGCGGGGGGGFGGGGGYGGGGKGGGGGGGFGGGGGKGGVGGGMPGGGFGGAGHGIGGGIRGGGGAAAAAAAANPAAFGMQQGPPLGMQAYPAPPQAGFPGQAPQSAMGGLGSGLGLGGLGMMPFGGCGGSTAAVGGHLGRPGLGGAGFLGGNFAGAAFGGAGLAAPPSQGLGVFCGGGGLQETPPGIRSGQELLWGGRL
eukprot:TRINITY_DN4868_c0_g1_i2.p1 TRINITY_DN4868_c0_g1~~TRINITY_DN4868_c0_g1_i2.p1  ORF type:complete len:562 (+),score=199.13 TRINITY_DN4868_c0_g1_i2:93-1688(+)